MGNGSGSSIWCVRMALLQRGQRRRSMLGDSCLHAAVDAARHIARVDASIRAHRGFHRHVAQRQPHWPRHLRRRKDLVDAQCRTLRCPACRDRSCVFIGSHRMRFDASPVLGKRTTRYFWPSFMKIASGWVSRMARARRFFSSRRPACVCTISGSRSFVARKSFSGQSSWGLRAACVV